MANTNNEKSSSGEHSVDETSATTESSMQTDEIASADPSETVRDESRQLDSVSDHSETSLHPTVDDTSSIQRNSDDLTRSTAFSDDDEVSEILQRDAEVSETIDEVSGVITEIIMSKTFIESIAPDREFVPIADGGDEVPADRTTESDTCVHMIPTRPTGMTSFPSAIDQKSNELRSSGHESGSAYPAIPPETR